MLRVVLFDPITVASDILSLQGTNLRVDTGIIYQSIVLVPELCAYTHIRDTTQLLGILLRNANNNKENEHGK
jgi:hypothetical protein